MSETTRKTNGESEEDLDLDLHEKLDLLIQGMLDLNERLDTLEEKISDLALPGLDYREEEFN